ncbi:MAG TPA: hypothetical protein VNZ58_02265 [Thermomicrobiales bacterium]|nr:hypothetical protein [Thermomicrobiales bacterium]
MASIWDTPYTGSSGGYSTGFGSNGGGTNPFYQQGSNYGADQDWASTPLTGTIREQNPQLAFSEWLGGLGIPDNDTSFNRYLYAQYPRFERAYGMATLQNPFITIGDFIQSMPGLSQLQQQFQSLSQQQRGEDWRSFSPQARWITR